MNDYQLNVFNRDTPDGELLDDLRLVAEQLGRSPTATEYSVAGRFHSSTLARRFGKWTTAIERAGLSPTRSAINIPVEDLLGNIESVWTSLGHQPTYLDMNSELSRFSAKTYANRFGSWRAALEAFVASVGDGGPITMTSTPSKSAPTGTRTRHINWRTRFKVLQRDHFACKACGKSPAKDPSVELHVDHVNPWSSGGESTMENLQTLCSTCNIGKSNLKANSHDEAGDDPRARS